MFSCSVAVLHGPRSCHLTRPSTTLSFVDSRTSFCYYIWSVMSRRLFPLRRVIFSSPIRHVHPLVVILISFRHLLYLCLLHLARFLSFSYVFLSPFPFLPSPLSFRPPSVNFAWLALLASAFSFLTYSLFTWYAGPATDPSSPVLVNYLF